MTEKIYAVRNYCPELLFRRFRRLAGAIIAIAFLATGSLMLSGGCSDSANSCNGSDRVRLACPAVSYETVTCIGYVFDIVDDSVEPPILVDGFNINFSRKCESIDCFTLQCRDITTDSGTFIPEAEIVIETVDGLPVGGNTNETVRARGPDGRIIIDGQDYLLESTGVIVP